MLYLVFEVKYKNNGLTQADPNTGLPRQMSDDWIDRDINNVFGEELGRELTRTRNYTRVIANVQPDGSITYKLIDSEGFKIRGLPGTFIP